MAEEKKPVEKNIVPPLNPADPIVIFDPFKLNSNILLLSIHSVQIQHSIPLMFL